MSLLRQFASASLCLSIVLPSGAAIAIEPNRDFSLTNFIEPNTGQVTEQNPQKLLSDHPGSATALTSTQKSEIRAFVKKQRGRQILVCSGLSLTGQRESMYRVVLLRAKLVCDYAKSLDSSITVTIDAQTTKERNHNGRILLTSQKPPTISKVTVGWV